MTKRINVAHRWGGVVSFQKISIPPQNVFSFAPAPPPPPISLLGLLPICSVCMFVSFLQLMDAIILFRCPVRTLFVSCFYPIATKIYLKSFSSLLSPNRGQKSLFYSDKQAFNLSGYMVAHPDDIPCLMLAHQQRK